MGAEISSGQGTVLDAKKQRLWGVAYVSFGFLLLLALFGYNPSQCPWISTFAADANGPRNPVGIAGASLSYCGLSSIGFSFVAIPLFFLRAGYAHLFRNARHLTVGRIRAMGILLLLLPIFCAFLQEKFSPPYPANFGEIFINGFGGWYGTILYEYFFASFLGNVGSALILGIPIFFSTWAIFTRQNSLSDAIGRRLENYGNPSQWFVLFANWLRRCKFFRRKAMPISIASDGSWSCVPIADRPRAGETLANRDEEAVDDALLAMKKRPVLDSLFTVDESNFTFPLSYYTFPPLDLLDEQPADVDDEISHVALGDELKDTLAQFGIDVEIGEIQSGPVITRFELLPAPGVRVEKIENLDKNIALTLRAPSVRILAPIPGRNCVGIEVPNPRTKPVCLRGILESSQWKNKAAEIPIVLGRGVTGEPLITDLARMPHLLIAGATGSGKTVCINSILASFLFHASPEDMRLILVDPKIVEMQVYNRLPHMLLPTLTDPKQVPNALRWLIHNMEWRYHLFASVGVRNIAGFNAKVTRTREEAEKATTFEKELSPEERAAMAEMQPVRRELADIPQQKLPYIVCVIDELADLMLVAPDDIENSVTRLAQLARAAGIHLILATQRPSVNVITGVIKANLPSRIAFKVASKVDSRTILDCNGADSLLGRGDMLFLPPGASSLLRAQGAWVSDEEINRIVDFLAQNGPPNFDRQAMEFVAHGQNGDE
ncbi:MAG: DNA translocase FtsK 4TM domain-containing protein [Puniceicoccales bacterium]|nr:DNA translocase FtsK 4TM domain-containing protein [Puniceicoccales bacterium]